MNPTILIVDDNTDTVEGLAELLRRKGYRPLQASCLQEMQALLEREPVDAILLDENLPDGSGIEQVSELRQARPRTAIIVITGAGDIPTAVKALQEGADDFLTKPIHGDELNVVLEKSIQLEHLKWMDYTRQRLGKKEELFIGKSDAAKAVWDLARTAATNEAAVILCGETGVGKGVLARWIHDNGERKSKPFVEVNCSGLSGDLLSSELFGHRKGAFTSAMESREGLLELADGGTLFLDEIGDMAMAVQAQFLKVIEEKRFRRVGESKARCSDFRLICATNRDLARDCDEGRFRRDLFFRIFVYPIDLPPLRYCRQDIPPLASILLRNMGYGAQSLSAEGMALLQGYDWPGNVREMANVLERACLIAQGQPLVPEHFPGLSTATGTGAPRHDAGNKWTLDDLESEHIHKALAHFGNDPAQTSEALGISRATLYRKLKKHGIVNQR